MTSHPDTDTFSPVLWDATPGACCAAYQLGACSHTEAHAYDAQVAADLADRTPAEVAAHRLARQRRAFDKAIAATHPEPF